jgi:hypothetical protein
MKKLINLFVLILMCAAVFSFSGCSKNHKLSSKEKALIEKAVEHRNQLTEDEEAEFIVMLSENNYAANYYGNKKSEWETRNIGKPSTVRPKPIWEN